MKIVRIVHTADLHLGSNYSSTPEIAQERKQEQLENLSEIIGICKDRDADILLIAGDLFESVRVDAQMLAQVQDMLEESGVDVFISPGNHDPVVPDSCYNDPDWPLNVHIFKGGLESVERLNEPAPQWDDVLMPHLTIEFVRYRYPPSFST